MHKLTASDLDEVAVRLRALRIDVLDAGARVEEVARMLGGLEITATTRQHARELLAS